MRKPGAGFGFQPKDTLASTEAPKFAKMVREQAPPKAPLQPLHFNQTNGNSGATPTVHDLTADSPISSNPRPTSSHHPPQNAARPAVKASAFSKPKPRLDDDDDDARYASLFNPNKNRPEHHRRPERIGGPLKPTYKDRKPAPPPTFATAPGSFGNPINVPDGPMSRYSQPGVFAQHVDPKKAAADIKALLEGNVDEEDEDKDKEMKDGEAEVEDKSQVDGLKVRLLPHQVEGVEWMKGRELGPVKKGKVPMGGLLADDMGLGKTLQSISLILSNAKPADKHPGVEKATLVVAPLALIRQWEAELKEKVTDDRRLRVLVHHGPQRTKKADDLKRYDVVITTYQILVSEHGHTSERVKAGCFGVHWYRVILDEAHTIKNRNAKATKACYELQSVYRWCLSGTPMQNNMDELQSLVKFLRIKPYDDIREWKDHFEVPMKAGKGEIAIKRLHGVLRCFMKRRTKDILKEEGALSTGAKEGQDGEKSATSGFKVTERKVMNITTQFSPAEKRLYEKLAQRTDKSLEEMKNRGKVSYTHALVLLLRLRQVCDHPKLVEGKIEKDKDALSDEAKPKKGDDDVDALADLLGGLDVATKHCDICGWELNNDTRQEGTDKCKSCHEDLEYFKNNEDGGELKTPKTKTRTKKSKKSKKTKDNKETKSKKSEPAPTKRKPRNRRAILDSDDEEEEGDWVVSGDEQGSLRLGKAGGTDDENAEGEGESINTEDSEDDETQDGSKLESFVVDDGNDTKPDELRRAVEESDESNSEDDSFESVGEIQSRVTASQSQDTDEDEADSESEEDDEDSDDDGVSESEVESDSGSIDIWAHRKNKPNKGSGGNVLASSKVRKLLSLLREETGEHKFIVFSQFTSMLDLVEPFLRKEGLRYTRYDGSMRNDAREEALNSLRNDDRTRVLLCSLRCGALGLNLTAASRVVILEPFWNPFVEEQAIDRVHRLTQTVDVVVYRLTVENTVEARILELQDKKRWLAEQAIEGGAKKDALKLGVKDMLELFRHGSFGADDHYGDDNGRSAAKGVLEFSSGGDRNPKKKNSMSSNTSSRQESNVYGRRW